MKHLFASALSFAIVLLVAIQTIAGHAPLPPVLMQAKSIYIDNRSGDSVVLDRAYDELSKWGRFKIVSDPKDADVLFVLGLNVRTSGATATTTKPVGCDECPSSTRVSQTQYNDVTISVVKPGTGQILWSETKSGGFFQSATRGIVKDLKKRMEEQEKQENKAGQK
jgi:hypothetical protein